MLSSLRNHPFSVQAQLENVVVLSFAIPHEELEKLIPPPLELDVFDQKWGFMAAAVVQAKNLRPSFLPEWMGTDCHLMGYRIFVKYKDQRNRNLRGIYILKSQTDSQFIKRTGNLVTHYNYSGTDVQYESAPSYREILASSPGVKIRIDKNRENVQLPQDSPFEQWKDARKYCGPLPFTFTVNEEEKSILWVEGVRKNWKPHAITILEAQLDFINQFQFSEHHLACAFLITDVPYFWKKGVVERWG